MVGYISVHCDFLLNLVWTSQSSTKLLQAWNCMTPIPSLTAEQLQRSILADSKTARPAIKISLEERLIYIYVDSRSEQVCRVKSSLLAEHWFRNSSCLKGNCSFHPCQPLWTQPCTIVQPLRGFLSTISVQSFDNDQHSLQDLSTLREGDSG